MKISRQGLSSILFLSLPIIAFYSTAAIANDAESVYKDSTSNSIVIKNKMQVLKGKSIAKSTISSKLVSPSPIGCDIRTKQRIDLDPKNYRWYNEDVNTTFEDPAFKSHLLLNANLCMTYSDVDLTSFGAYTPELDVVQFGKTTLGVLDGTDGEKLTKCWNVTKRVSSSLASHIPFIVNVDAANHKNNWAVFLHEATLSTCHYRNYFVPPFEFPLK